MCSVELSAMVVLAVRTWAVWRKSPYILVFCGLAISAYLGIQIWNIKTNFAPVPVFRSQGPCIAAAIPGKQGEIYFAYPLYVESISRLD